MFVGSQYQNACVLIALDQIYGKKYWNREEFLKAYDPASGFDLDTMPDLLCEHAAMVTAYVGPFVSIFMQGQKHIKLFNEYTGITYIISQSTKVFFVYQVKSRMFHALCLHASAMHALMSLTGATLIGIPKKHVKVEYCGDMI